MFKFMDLTRVPTTSTISIPISRVTLKSVLLTITKDTSKSVRPTLINENKFINTKSHHHDLLLNYIPQGKLKGGLRVSFLKD